MKKIIKIIIPIIAMFLLVCLMRNDKDILTGIYFLFPIIHIILGFIYTNLKELVIGLILVSLSFLIPINLYFNMGSCIELVIFYDILSFISYLLKNRKK